MRVRFYHIYDDDGAGFCTKCNHTQQFHKAPRTAEQEASRGRRRKITHPRTAEQKKKRNNRKDRNITYIGIDGEGQGRTVEALRGKPGNSHRYVLLAASTESGDREWYVEASNPRIGRLTTVECLDMILELPTRRSKIFSYAFNYDITKMLEDLDDKSLFEIFRPDVPWRQRPKCEAFKGPYPVEWCSICKKNCPFDDERHLDDIYKLNLIGTKFSVRKGAKRVVVWDIFKFFGSKFVPALEDWKIGSEEMRKNMAHMKDQRNDFDKLDHQAVKNYCFEETRSMAELARKLIEAHEVVDLKLKSYYGAGSSGAAMLTSMGIKDKIFPAIPGMREGVASAFFGGRFENSVIGAIREPLDNLDISSAYVYQLAFLPCLEHGTWTHTTKRKDLEIAQAQNGALVSYSLGKAPSHETAWGPFPFRTKDGSISFPLESGGGWLWLDEYLAGEKIFSHVQFKEAWVYSCNCACRPFARIPEYYNHRLRIGKEGPGIVIKLGMNSCYGKLAQSVGNALFNSWIWAGMITSGCRAQILDVMGLHKEKRNLLMIATDGIYTREDIDAPRPLPTKTDGLFPDDKGVLKSKPLGGWEHKAAPKGVFVARPGIYFPLEPTKEEIKSVRARGVGRSVVLESWQIILDAWEKKGIEGVARVGNVSRFCGGKTSVSISAKNGKATYKRAKNKDLTKPSYGQWVTREVALTFDPLPKRERINEDGVTLKLRAFPRDLRSIPYSRAVSGMSREASELIAAKQELMEQPDGDLIDYETTDGNG